jgi:acetyl-CoA carboxylase carboxyl transferase subunit beta
VTCRAAGSGADNGAYVNGPIQVPHSSPIASDPVTAATDKSKTAVDRSKGLWTRCDKCGVILYVKHLKEHHHICFGCGHHLKMSSMERIDHLIDPDTWRPLDETLSPVDPLEFFDLKAYPDRVREAQEKTGMQDGVRTGTGLLHGIPIALGVMEFGFMGGSMGSVVGEKLTRLIEHATQEGLPVIIVCTSGGARMQEGIFSLMQVGARPPLTRFSSRSGSTATVWLCEPPACICPFEGAPSC